MLDFLKEIVETVPDPSAGGTIDLESENAEGTKKKRGKGKKVGTVPGEPPTKRRRKKKGDVGPGTEGDGEADGEMRSETEHDADVAMHEDSNDGREKNGGMGYRPRSPSADGDWPEDTPFMPNR